MRSTLIPRSYLYVPGDRRDMLEGAPDRAADALIIDLEDAVAPSAKEAARGAVRDWLADGVIGPELWIRVNNHPDLLEEDVAVAAQPGVAGVVLPKAESEAGLRELEDHLSRAERRIGLEEGQLGIIPLLESARGILAAAAIATTSPRVPRLGLGEADLAADLGLEPGPDQRELLGIRSSVVVACAAAGIDPPLGPTPLDFRDPDLVARSSQALKRLGFLGRSAIHPAQVPMINRVFTPTDGELAEARRLVEVFEQEVKAGRGVVMDKGRIIDEAVIRRYRRLLRLARSPE